MRTRRNLGVLLGIGTSLTAMFSGGCADAKNEGFEPKQDSGYSISARHVRDDIVIDLYDPDGIGEVETYNAGTKETEKINPEGRNRTSLVRPYSDKTPILVKMTDEKGNVSGRKFVGFDGKLQSSEVPYFSSGHNCRK